MGFLMFSRSGLLNLLAVLVLACQLSKAFAVLDDYTMNSIANMSSDSATTSIWVLDYTNPQSLLAKMLIPRAVGSANLTKVQNVIRDHFSSLSTTLPAPFSSPMSGEKVQTWQVFEDSFDATTPYGPKTFTNLVYTHDPLAERKLVIAAHTDSKYFPSFPQNTFIGATDSAVPCGLMLELASALNSLLNDLVEDWEGGNMPGNELRTTLQFVFFDGEEAFKQWTNTDSIYGAK